MPEFKIKNEYQLLSRKQTPGLCLKRNPRMPRIRDEHRQRYEFRSKKWELVKPALIRTSKTTASSLI